MKQTKICFVGTDPNFDGGMSLYQKNVIKYLKKNYSNINITWVYTGKESKKYKKDEVNYVELKNIFPYPLNQIVDNFKILKYLNKNKFDIINSHAVWGEWMRRYKRKDNERLIHTYHGVTYNFFRVHMLRFSFIMKALISPMLLFSYLIEKPPIKKADKIICVAEKVERELKELYNTNRDMEVLRTGVDLKDFNVKNKKDIRKKLNLEQDKIYGLYIGQGGYWRKGLDRAVKISEQIYKKNKNYHLLVIGADYKKVKKIIDGKEFLTYPPKRIPREEIPLYYNASDIFFCFSRYEGGAPIMTTSEAMASGCLLVCSKDAEQEIIKDKKNGLIIESFDEDDASKVIHILTNTEKRDKIIEDSIQTAKELSLEKWGEKYLDILLN
ncbi:MAG: glycosyltransferase family 4 protein [Nanobdellota archaeon]